MHQQPLVTVYLPTHNRVDLLARAVDSILNQTYPNIELIVVDDASTDTTENYLTTLAESNPRVRYIQNTSNQGACVSRNKAIAVAGGEFITGADDDDYFTEDRIADFVEFWQHKKEDTVALFSSRTKLLENNTSVRFPGAPLVSLKELYLRNLAGSQLFLPTMTARKLDGFDPELRVWQDLEFILRVARLGNLESTMRYTYVVDTSHPHERISKKKVQVVENSHQYIVNKHRLGPPEANRLESQILVYEFTLSRLTRLAAKFAIRGDLDALKALLMRSYRALRH